jgi:hypothetical protein
VPARQDGCAQRQACQQDDDQERVAQSVHADNCIATA